MCSRASLRTLAPASAPGLSALVPVLVVTTPFSPAALLDPDTRPDHQWVRWILYSAFGPALLIRPVWILPPVPETNGLEARLWTYRSTGLSDRPH